MLTGIYASQESWKYPGKFAWQLTDAEIRGELFDIYKYWNDELRVVLPAYYSGGGAPVPGDIRYIGCTYRDSWDANPSPLNIKSDASHPNTDGYHMMAASIFNRTYDYLYAKGLIKDDKLQKVDITALYNTLKGL